MPSRNHVKQAMAMIRGRAEYEYFFARLDTPKWIDPLLEEGRFDNPPPPIQDADAFRLQSWPESQYLARVAAEAPEAAGRVLLHINQPANPLIHEDLAEVAAKVDLDTASKWAKKETAWLADQRWLSYGLPEKLFSLCERLAAGGRMPEAIGFLRTLFAPIPDARVPKVTSEGNTIPPRPIGRFEGYVYNRLLRRAVSLLGQQQSQSGLRALVELLNEAVRLSLSDAPDPPTDYSFIWRDGVEDVDEERSDVRSALVDAVRDLAVALAEQGLCNEALQTLESQPWRIFRRIALHVLRVACNSELTEIRARLVDAEAFNNPEIRHEYVLLLRDNFDRLNGTQQEEILSWVSTGPDRVAMRKRHLRATGEALSPELEHAWVEHWQRDRLAPLQHVLPPVWRARFEALHTQHGPAVFDLSPMGPGEVQIGFASPVTVEQLRAMESESLRRYLRDWVPSEGFNAPTREGVVENLRALGDGFFLDESSRATEWKDLHAQYISAFLAQMIELLRSGTAINWQQIILLVSHVADSRGTDEDSKWARKHVADLLKVGFDSGVAAPPRAYRDQLWVVLSRLLERDDADEADAEMEGDSLDALTPAINSFKGRLTEAVIRFAIWVKRDEAPNESGWRLRDRLPPVAATLDRLVDPEVDQSVRTRAIFGVQLGPLLWLDAQWAVERKSALFPVGEVSADLRAAVWETFIVYAQPYGLALELFQDQYVDAVNALSPDSPSSRAREAYEERLAEHLMTYYWQGLLTLDTGRPLEGFFTHAAPRIRRRAISFVGRGLYAADEIAPKPLTRLAELMDWRIAAVEAHESRAPDDAAAPDLQEYGWWFVSGKLDPAWAIDRLLRILRLIGRVDPRHQTAEALIGFVDEFPREVAECIRRLVEGAEQPHEIASWLESARTILIGLAPTDDTLVREERDRTLNALVARRFTEFRLLAPEAP